jgi:3-oxoacyl-[acyl-carrier protein] reductase
VERSCVRALINQMLERGDGRIINIASQLGQIGGGSVSHYAASKAGVIGLTKSLPARSQVEVCS